MKKIIAIVCLTVFLSGCANIPNSKIEDCGNRYMESFKNNDFASMYGMIYEKAKAGMPYDSFETMHKKVIARLGKIKEIKKGRIMGYNFSFAGNTYDVVYDIDFEIYKGVYSIKVFSGGNMLSIIGWNVDSEGLI
jgi:hypothetical protein